MTGSIEIGRRRLDAARLAGSAAVAVLGQFAVDAPQGYFGPADRMTRVGAIFLVVVVALALVASALRLRGSRLYIVPALAQVGVVLAAFVPPLASDPVVSAAEMFWHVLLFGRLVFGGRPLGHPSARRRADEGEAPDVWQVRSGPAARHLLGVSLLVAIAVLGFQVGDRVPAQVVCLVLGTLALGVAAPYLFMLARARAWGPVLVGVPLVAALASLRLPDLALSLSAGAQAVAFVILSTRTRLASDLLEQFYRRPAYLILTSFVLLIALGTLFLSFPVASAGPQAISPVDAMFTATSAACVTGLIVLDTPNDFSTFGLVVILLLIQVGGLSIMVLSAFAALLLGRGLGLLGESALGSILDLERGQSLRRLVLFIVGGTALLESVGALVLTVRYINHGYAPGVALWHGVFHSISAFCNAGFALHTASLINFNRDPWMLLTIAGLITLGGLGFGVLADLGFRFGRGLRRPVGLQTRVVLTASAFFIFGGALVYALVEWHGTLAGLSTSDRVVNAVFQSVTLRTAGYNSVPMEFHRPATVLLMMVWMFIGASPGGTGGGIKTTTAVVLVGSVLAILGRRSRVVLFRRSLSLDTVYRSSAIVTVGTLVVLFGTFALLLTQAQPFQVLLFEVISAFGTVGLSLGVTPSLDEGGKIVVAAMMLAGRVGPLMLALLVGQGVSSRLVHPDARLMVG